MISSNPFASASASSASMSMIECREEETPPKTKTKTTLEKKESIEKERQISVDPISLTSPANRKLVSCSLPNSPRFELTSAKQKKKYKNQQPSLLSRQQSVALGNLERLRMQRSKSCGEGRTSQPSMDFDLWPTASASTATNQRRDISDESEEGKTRGRGEDKFKCGTCLFLPSLVGKGKSVRKEEEEEEEMMEQHARIIVSQRVSLEKFECGSWRSSSAIINYQEDGDDDAAAASNLFFDLPLELMRCGSVNDTESPVTTGFLFDSNRKGVLKVGKSHESCNSSRHVRFSTSSPTSPRLRKARDDFTAFLEAQSA